MAEDKTKDEKEAFDKDQTSGEIHNGEHPPVTPVTDETTAKTTDEVNEADQANKEHQTDEADEENFPEAVIYQPSAPPEKTGAAAEVVSVTRDAINYFVIAVLFLGLGVFLGLNIGSDPVDADTLRGIVRAEIEANSALQVLQMQELILSLASGGDMDTEALQALIQAAVEQAAAPQVNYMDGNGPSIGPADAPVVIVEFSDFLCSFCGRHFDETLSRILQNYEGQVRYVYRDFPGVGGENAVASGLAAKCAHDQGRFWDYHDILFSNQNALMVDLITLNQVLIGFAEDLNLDMAQFTPCLQNRVHIASVFQDRTDAQNIGARGTPAFLINGIFVSGAQPYEIFASIIDAQLREAGS